MPWTGTGFGAGSTTSSTAGSAGPRAGRLGRPRARWTPSAQSAEVGEQIGFDRFKHCRGGKRHLVTDALGFLCARTVTAASASDRAAGRKALAQAAERHPSLGLCWVDGGYANAVDGSIIEWARENTPVDVEVVKRTDDLRGFVVLPRRWVIERTNAWLSAHRRLARDFERLTGDRRGHDRRDGQPARRGNPVGALADHGRLT